MKPQRIFVTADPEIPVPPTHYGGIERIIALLVDGLVSRGHDVTLFAHPSSTVPCRLVGYPGGRSGSAFDSFRNSALLALKTARHRPTIIQSFGRVAYLAPVLPTSIPKVMSYQRIVTARAVTMAHRLSRGTLSFTGCSRFLIEPVNHIGRWRAIYNAVPVERFAFTDRVDDEAPLVFLGRVERIKGPHIAARVAKAAGRRLVIAGNVPDEREHADFFDRELRPQIDGDRVKFVGPVNDAQKSELLSGAAALLMPILWDEPFGIVMAEAFACGTPVVGFWRGAVPEVVADGLTGFVRQTEEELVAALASVGRLSRAACRASAEARFSRNALVDAYETLYEEVTHG